MVIKYIMQYKPANEAFSSATFRRARRKNGIIFRCAEVHGGLTKCASIAKLYRKLQIDESDKLNSLITGPFKKYFG